MVNPIAKETENVCKHIGIDEHQMYTPLIIWDYNINY